MTTDHEQAYPYVIGALSSSEAAEFERHLEGCSACTEEVSALRSVTAELSSTVATAPPPELRAAVLAAISATPQRDVEQGKAPASRSAASTAPSTSARASTAPASAGVVRPLRSRYSWAPALLAAAAVIAALGFGGWAWHDRQSANAEARRASALTAQLTELLSARDVKMASGHGESSQTTGTVVLSPSRNEVVLVASDLPALPAGKVYEAWTIRKHPVPAGTFTPAESKAVVKLPPRALHAASVALTVEPAGGSPAPTSNPIITVNVPELS